MTTQHTELIERSNRIAAELADHNANMDRRARTCIRELVSAIEALEAMEKSHIEILLRIETRVDELIAERDDLQAELSTARAWLKAADEASEQREAQLAAAQGQEPAGYLLPTTGNFVHAGTVMAGHSGANWVKLYSTPIPQQPAQQAQPERAPLSTDTIADIARRMEATNCEDSLWVEFTRAIEAAIKQGGQHD